ncbi:hypothetical protein SCHPADRAFT_793283, partial [Schizopora paradoxa]
DYALASNGARVIGDVTSQSIEPNPSYYRMLLGLFLGGLTVANGPLAALSTNLEVGDCWPIGGTHGLLGIHLSNTIIVENIAIDHINRLSAFDVGTAPRSMRLWGMLEDAQSQNRTVALLSEFQYDINKPQSQIFSVIPITQAHIFRKVILEIQGNWGSSESTCLYRVRVHG